MYLKALGLWLVLEGMGEKRQDTKAEAERRGPAWFRLSCRDTGGDRHACCRQRPIKVGCFGPRHQSGQKGTKAGVGGECLAACLLASAASCWLSVKPWGSCEVPRSKISCFSHSSFLTSSFFVIFFFKKLHIFNIVCVPKLRGWFVGVSSRLPVCGCWGLQPPLPAEPSCWPVFSS